VRRAAAAAVSVVAGLAAVLVLHGARPSLPPVGGSPSLRASTGRPSSRPPPPASASPPTTRPGATSSALGASEQYGFGVLSVTVTVTAHHIDNVTVTRLQTAESYSQSLAEQAIPILRNEVLAAQSAQVNAVSGATYTSEAYAYSVQSALDQLHW